MRRVGAVLGIALSLVVGACDATAKIDCKDGLGTVTDGATQVSRTSLVIAADRTEGVPS